MDSPISASRQERIELILHHYENRTNRRSIPGALEGTAKNPACDDREQVYVQVEDGVITDASYEAEGCTISQASASIAVEMFKGKPVNDLLDITYAEVVALIGEEFAANRVKCVQLVIEAARSALQKSEIIVKGAN